MRKPVSALRAEAPARPAPSSTGRPASWRLLLCGRRTLPSGTTGPRLGGRFLIGLRRLVRPRLFLGPHAQEPGPETVAPVERQHVLREGQDPAVAKPLAPFLVERRDLPVGRNRL